MKVLKESDRLHPYPRGWYAVGTGFDLKPGELRHTAFMGTQIVYFRTESGRISVLDAYCKHTGSHLGHGGRVAGEAVVCPYHHFHWGADGTLVHVPGLKKCPKLQQGVHPVDEKWGYVMVWYDPDGLPPTFSIPPVVDNVGGQIDRLIGDALMVTFNTRGDQPDHSERAARAGDAQRHGELRRVHKLWRPCLCTGVTYCRMTDTTTGPNSVVQRCGPVTSHCWSDWDDSMPTRVNGATLSSHFSAFLMRSHGESQPTLR
jgi:nitrite reductase/ring-hydroxylating ferredoxin subunit